jgi:predicted ribosomally synthesized peptide with nif11-like leader
MADISRAEQLVRAMETDSGFHREIEAAPNMEARRAILQAHGFGDVTADDMRAYRESRGESPILPENDRELSDEELELVAGGSIDGDAAASAAAAA